MLWEVRGEEGVRTIDLMQDTTAPIVAVLRDVNVGGEVVVRLERKLVGLIGRVAGKVGVVVGGCRFGVDGWNVAQQEADVATTTYKLLRQAGFSLAQIATSQTSVRAFLLSLTTSSCKHAPCVANFRTASSHLLHGLSANSQAHVSFHSRFRSPRGSKK
jgi:hypothetical protein